MAQAVTVHWTVTLPHKARTEVVVKLSKFKVDQHVQIKVEENELNNISVKNDATYREIKDYVKNKFNLTVSTLYIAQIERKLGLTERENFNKSKKSDSKIPKSPLEREQAIKESFVGGAVIEPGTIVEIIRPD